MGKILFLFLLLPIIISAQAEPDIIFSEIMFAPQSGNNEFIELYNLSENESVNLNKYKIKYQTSNPDNIESTGSGTILPPKSFAVIFEGDYDFNSGIYKSLIPSNALILKIGDNSFGSSGMSNSSQRILYLLNSIDEILETYTYTADNKNGISDEKIVLNNDTSQSNWANSTTENGTPGFGNSVTPLRFNLTFGAISITPLHPKKDDDIEISFKIVNKGTKPASNYSVEVFNDLNEDSTGSSSELIYQNSFLNLFAEDSNDIAFRIQSAEEGVVNLIINIIFDDDENLNDNFEYYRFYVSPPANNYNDLVINEIMYAPLNNEPEWIEIFNRCNSSLNLNNWSLSDASTTIKIIKEDKLLEPGNYIIVSKDSSIFNFYAIPCEVLVTNLPSLNNSGDQVIIKDSSGMLIDSLEYFSSWGENLTGKSIERISITEESNDEENWKISESKFNGTPGRINSVTRKDFDIAAAGILFSPEFPMINENVNISVKIMNIGKNDAKINIKLYEDTNLDSLPDVLIYAINGFCITAGDSEVIPANYMINNLQTKKGFYISAVYLQDQDTLNNSAYSIINPGFPEGSVVINEIMYNPFGGEPEWIELFNATDHKISLEGWTINDVLTTPATYKITDEKFINPKSYLIISKDSSILNYHKNISSEIITANLPVFNNDMDGVVLKDDRVYIIDSVFYNKDWEGKQGSSYERISFEISSNLPSNWGNSRDVELSTPGRINSIKPKNFDLMVTDLSFIPRFPVPGDNVYLSAKVKNNGTSSALFSINFYFDSKSDNKPDQLLYFESGINLNSNDSIDIISKNPINNVSSKILSAVKINYENDEDTLNNYYEKVIEPGIKQKALIINEVMFSPSTDESEWIELVNISSDTLNLKGWTISDLFPKPSKNFISTDEQFLEPGEYFIIAHDSSFFSFYPEFEGKIKLLNFGTLGNTGDGIIIYDFRGGIIDSLKYKSSWGGKNGYSLERFSFNLPSNDSANWATSLSENKSTPGKENSLISIPSYKKNDLVINEIMFDPEVNNSEFIEFYNPCNSNINIGGWRIVDGLGNYYKLSDVNFNISPNEFFVLAADSLIFENYDLSGFNNITILNKGDLGLSKEEKIVLKDLKGNIVDSIFYSEKWHNKNFVTTKNTSLEKINPRLDSNSPLNWSSSVNSIGGTPGRINSIFSEGKNTGEKISVSPNPFSPDNDGYEDFTIINYSLSQNKSQVRVKIFDNRGRLLRTLLNNQPSGSKGSVVFDGLEEDGTPFRMGIYIVFLEALNEVSGVSETLKTVVVVARKL